MLFAAGGLVGIMLGELPARSGGPQDDIQRRQVAGPAVFRDHKMLRHRKIRLIEPRGRPGRPFNAWITRWPLLGPITLASILEQRGYDVAAYSETISGSVLDDPAIYEDLCSADVVGISVMTPTAARGYEIADRLRADAPGVTIALGGVHATFMPQEALAHADIVVRGEGETVIEAIAAGQAPPGIIQAQPLANLDELPTLNHFLLHDFEKLVAGRRRALYELPVMTSRGCPNACIYCSVTQMFGRKVRRQSVEKVHRDLTAYAEQGFRHLFFYDDNFTTDRAWTRRLLARVLPMGMRFNAQARADFHWEDRSRRRRDEPLLRMLRRASGNVLYVGYETVDESTARQWRKGYRGGGSLQKRLREDTRILHDSGFWIHGMFIMGPGHTDRTADRIVDFARRGQIESIQISILTPAPGTRLFEQMRPHLMLTEFPNDWDFYDGTHCVYNHGRLGVEGLQRAVLRAHRRFYNWGGWNVRRIRALLEQPVPMADKLSTFWRNARIARKTLRAWRNEIDAFLEMVRLRR